MLRFESLAFCFLLLVLPAGGCTFGSGGADAGLDGSGDDGSDGGDQAADAGCPGSPLSSPRSLEASTVLGAGGFFGVSGRVLGDLHGGQPTFAVGAHYADISDGIGEEHDSGRVYLFAGSDVPTDLGEADLVLQAPDGALWGGFGYAIGPACDFDDDGSLDLPVGNHLCCDPPASGRAVVFWGDPSGELSQDRTSLHRLADDLRRQNDSLGQTVLCADFNSDGYDDLLATGQNAGEHDTGLGAIFYGGPTGLPEFPDAVLEPRHLAERQYLGASSLWADLDGDGLEDLAVGGWGLIKGGRMDGPHTGGVAVYLGGADWSAGPSFGLFPPGDYEVSAGVELALVGPPERRFLAVGAPYIGRADPEDPDDPATGGVVLYEVGSSEIHAGTPFQVLQPPEGTLDVGFGQSLAWVPDLDGPGLGALLVGMKYGHASVDNPFTGAVAVFRLASTGQGFDRCPEILAAPDPLSGDSFGGSIVPLGDRDGDGSTDFLVGIEGHLEGDIYTGTQTGGVVIYH